MCPTQPASSHPQQSLAPWSPSERQRPTTDNQRLCWTGPGDYGQRRSSPQLVSRAAMPASKPPSSKPIFYGTRTSTARGPFMNYRLPSEGATSRSVFAGQGLLSNFSGSSQRLSDITAALSVEVGRHEDVIGLRQTSGGTDLD